MTSQRVGRTSEAAALAHRSAARQGCAVPAPTPPILVVDDDEDARSLLEWILRTKGYTTVAVETGRAALEYLRDRKSVV